MESEIHIGTSGFDYPEWRDVFYPENLERKSFLAFYSECFDTVELNFSYYRMPEARQLASFAAKARPDCLFAIKAHQSLTHEIDPHGWRDALAEYREALSPLLIAGRLGAVLFQFPPSFHYEEDKRRYLDSLLRASEGLPLVVEFRNRDWYNNRVFSALRERSVALAALDLPDLPGLPPAVDLVTAPLAYVRLHGRNRETWWGSDAAARYDYLYDEEELSAWALRIKAIAPKVKRILVYFNNHWKGQAPRNAAMMKTILEGKKPVP